MKNFSFNNVKAFTLAELLIVIAVVGAMALISVPVLYTKAKKANEVQFRKAYYNLEKIVNYLINESGYYMAENGFAYTTPISDEGVKNKFCYWLKDSLNVEKDYGCPEILDSGSKRFARTSDNSIWFIYPATFTTEDDNFNNKIIIDVNGDKKPNCLSNSRCSTFKPEQYSCGCSNPDTFVIGVRYDGKIKVEDDNVAVKILSDKSFIN